MTARSDGAAEESTGPQRQVVDLEERTWLPRHCRGDQAAFPALMAAYRRPVYSFVVRAGVAEADRDDVFQSIFLKVHSAAGSYEPARPLAPWIFTITANTVRNYRRARRNPASTAENQDSQEVTDPHPNLERVVQARETVAWLEGAMAMLPAAQREVLMMTTLGGLRQQDIAEALDLPLNTVKTHLRRARLTLAKAMAGRDTPADCVGDTDDTL